LIQTRDGSVHLTASHFTPGGKTMRHWVFKV
jgi:hypothetical protein